MANGTARLWDLTADDPTVASIVLPDYQGEIAHHVNISPDNRWAVTANQAGTTYVWKLTKDGAPTESIRLPLLLVAALHGIEQ